MKEEQNDKVNSAKRDFLKKAAVTAFTIPVMQTFTLGELHADHPSGGNNGVGDRRGAGKENNRGRRH